MTRGFSQFGAKFLCIHDDDDLFIHKECNPFATKGEFDCNHKISNSWSAKQNLKMWLIKWKTLDEFLVIVKHGGERVKAVASGVLT